VKIQLRVRSLGTREERTEDDGSGPGRFVTIHVEVIAHRTPMCQRRISLAIRLWQAAMLGFGRSSACKCPLSVSFLPRKPTI